MLLPLAFLAGAPLHADNLAYAMGEGSRLPLPENIATIDAHYLVELDWTYRGGRSTVAVLPVEDASDTTSASSHMAAQNTGADAGETVPLAAINAVVLDTMRRTGRFDVDGDPSNVPSKGYTLRVSVATYESVAARRVSNPRAIRTQGPDVESGRVALLMRLLGSAGEVVVVDRFEAVVEEPRSEFVGAGDGLSADLWRTSVGQAALAAINKGVYEVVKTVGPLPVSGRVIRVEEDRLWVNLGAGAVSVGDELEVTAEGEVLVDPETGLDLGGVETILATFRVVKVEERFSVAQQLTGTGTPSRGDSVRRTSAPSEFQFAADWNPPGREDF